MYIPKSGIKRGPERRWALPDQIFFGHGACHILAGAYLESAPLSGFHAERIIPLEGFAGNHIYVTDGEVTFDYNGYSLRKHFIEHHRKGWSRQHHGWDCLIENVDFDLLSTTELSQRKMLSPDQYLFDPVPRARRFIERINHPNATGPSTRASSADLGVSQRSVLGSADQPGTDRTPYCSRSMKKGR